MHHGILSRFIYIDVGANGRVSDGGIWRDCSFNHKLQNDALNVPKERSLPGSDECTPCVLIADEAFPLRSFLMKPYAR